MPIDLNEWKWLYQCLVTTYIDMNACTYTHTLTHSHTHAHTMEIFHLYARWRRQWMVVKQWIIPHFSSLYDGNSEIERCRICQFSRLHFVCLLRHSVPPAYSLFALIMQAIHQGYRFSLTSTIDHCDWDVFASSFRFTVCNYSSCK